MKRIVLWLLSTLSVVLLLFGYHTSTSGPVSVAPGTAVYSGTLAGAPASTGGSGGSGGSGGTGSGSGGSGGNGSTTVTGDVAQTQWGPVQLALTVQGGTITGVEVLQYPTGNGNDEQINAYALPILIQETLDSQSSSIDMVSGATVTSVGYQQSLQSALDQASL